MDGPDGSGAARREAEGSSAGRLARRRGGRQVIPRPRTALPGGAAPWASLPREQRSGIGLDQVRASLMAERGALYGTESVAPPGFPEPRAPAAVLVALFEEESEARVVLTRRAAHLRTHTAEVAFPGGRCDPGESPESTALRESCEEIGLDPATVETIRRLSPLSTFSSGTTITPVVGLMERRPALHPNPGEVERVFDVSLAELASDGLFREELWQVPPGEPFPVWFFELEHDTIWGATARMLMELLRLVLHV